MTGVAADVAAVEQREEAEAADAAAERAAREAFEQQCGPAGCRAHGLGLVGRTPGAAVRPPRAPCSRLQAALKDVCRALSWATSRAGACSPCVRLSDAEGLVGRLRGRGGGTAAQAAAPTCA
jgi:hypothetical protein